MRVTILRGFCLSLLGQKYLIFNMEKTENLLQEKKRKRKKIKRRQGIKQIKFPLNFSSDCISRNIVPKISVKVFQRHLPHSFFVKPIPEAKKFNCVNLQREKAQILIDL